MRARSRFTLSSIAMPSPGTLRVPRSTFGSETRCSARSARRSARIAITAETTATAREMIGSQSTGCEPARGSRCEARLVSPMYLENVVFAKVALEAFEDLGGAHAQCPKGGHGI